MAAYDQTFANTVLNASLDGGAATLSTANMHVRLMTANGTSTSNGTELATSGSYTALTGITPAAFSAASAGSKANSGTLSQTGMPATTIVGIEIWDSNGTPKRVMFGALTASKTLNSGDTLSFAASSITATLT